MKVAIFHNLTNGGGLNQLRKIKKFLERKNIKVEVFSHKVYINTKNSFDLLKKAFVDLKNSEESIAQVINKKKFDYIFIFPCRLTQSPQIINFLPPNKTFYFFLESKREFYEKTSFDHYSIKRIFSRLIRYPIKLLDRHNCKKYVHIISNSYYTQHLLRKIYNKNSIVIYPGYKEIKPIVVNRKNNNKYLSFGLLTMLKGHHLSADITTKVDIYGQISHENLSKHIKNFDTKFIKNKHRLYSKYTFFLANQIREPFGLTTLEATSNKCFIFGRNEGGTSEILHNGLNGILFFTENLQTNKKIISYFSRNDIITFYKTCIIDWNNTVNQILDILTYA